MLGLKWDTSDDTLRLAEVKLSQRENVTKRQCLSDLSTLYDPIGLFAPITFVGKILMRDIWKLKVGWDEKLPETFRDRLNEIVTIYNQLHNVSLPRQCIEDGSDLHVFCDASGEGYGCVAYSVTPTHSKLVMSRSRIAPVSTRSIVQLELTALLLGCRLAQYLITEIHHFENVIIWSDNQCCISWMNDCKIKDVYVKNRVAEAKRLIEAFQFQIKYVSTKRNPADILSRGADLETLMNSNWFEDSPQMFALAQIQNDEIKFDPCKLKSDPCIVKSEPCKLELEVAANLTGDLGFEALHIENEKVIKYEENVTDSTESSSMTHEDSNESNIENGVLPPDTASSD